MHLDDTIVAIATAPQPSGIGVLRISGPRAVECVATHFQGADLHRVPSHRLSHGWIMSKAGEPLDEVLVAVMRAPRSYTAETVVEIQGHGSPLTLESMVRMVLENGARLAEPGEFTRRAFLNGRLDLTQVEAVSDLIHARSESGRQVAVRQLRGKLFRAIEAIEEQVAQVAALVEACIEFPEEGTVFTHHEDCLKRIDQASADLRHMLEHADQGRRMREGVSLALIGEPNVGKSSLMNALLREQRAIVTEIPGTTRDSLEERLHLKGLAFRIIDTAGIRTTADVVEQEGIRRSRNAWQQADLTLILLDASRPLGPESLQLLEEADPERTVTVLNKMDLCSQPPHWLHPELPGEQVLLSARTGEGLELLEALLVRKAMMGEVPAGEEIWITNLRQQQSAERALEALEWVRDGLVQDVGEECLAVDLRTALNALGAIVGATTPDDLLGKIFAEFCIGK